MIRKMSSSEAELPNSMRISPSVTQTGEPCDTFAAMEEYPEEYYNKDMQISDGSELSCAYAVSLKDAVSPISLTVHDNYDTFADVGTTEIALQ